MQPGAHWGRKGEGKEAGGRRHCRALTHTTSPDWLCTTLLQYNQALGHLDMLVTRVGVAIEAAQQEVQGQAAPALCRRQPSFIHEAAGSGSPWPCGACHTSCECRRRMNAGPAAAELLQAQLATPAGKQRRAELVLHVEEALALRGGTYLACPDCAVASETGFKGRRCGGCHLVATAARPAATPTGGGIDASSGGCRSRRHRIRQLQTVRVLLARPR